MTRSCTSPLARMRVVLILVGLALSAVTAPLRAEAQTLRVAVTTSFHNSGLSDVLLPKIREQTGLSVQLLVVGTGQALRLGRAGDVDAILVHSRSAEEQFVAQGHATHRREIMYNDFVIIGPSSDPALVAKSPSLNDALTRLHQAKPIWISRGDDSGTHRRELALWSSAGIEPASLSAPWYRSVGAGMGAALNVASAMNGYILADRASWLNFANKRELKLLFEGDSQLFNQYAFLPLSKMRHPHVNETAAAKLETWLAGKAGQTLIGSYRIAGQTLFVPNATQPSADN